ncbi:hypothetical protein NMG60_11022937 [Bertholletia excelsa]
MGDWLPEGWQVKIEIYRNGSKNEIYVNTSTGQTFHSKKDLLRYVNYKTNLEPHMEAFRAAYMDEERLCFVDRPWEQDPQYTLHDYILGRVGKLAVANLDGTSSSVLTEATPRAEPLPRSKHEASASTSGGSSTLKPKKKNKKSKMGRQNLKHVKELLA